MAKRRRATRTASATGLLFVVDEAQRGDGQHMVEAGVGEWQVARIAFHPFNAGLLWTRA